MSVSIASARVLFLNFYFS